MGKVCNASGSDDDTAIEKTFTKGPWTEEEDDLLIAYVDKHGDGNWNAVQKHSGLSRCGKSCRLRWVNHLRPDLKKGAFTEKEEKRVIELHALLGNKWARMAGELPGRTDNEIKNFWNTRLKRLQRLGLPVYPDEVREQVMNAATQSGLNTDSLDAHHSQDSLEADCVEIPEFNFAQSSFNQCSSYYQSMLHRGRQRPCFVQPNMYNMIASPYMSTRKRSRESETAFPCMGGYAMNEQNPPLWNYPFVDNIPGLLLPDSHLLGNAKYSSPPGPLIHEVQKLELPSFQYDNSPGSLGAQQSNPMSEHEPETTLVQSPLTTDDEPSDCPPSSLYDGLLESTVYGSSVEKRATDTDSESPLFQSSLLGHTELTPANENTTGYVGSTSSNERPFDGDWIKFLLGEDRNNTELTPANEITESPLFQSSLLGHTELTPTNENTTGYVGSTSSNERPFDGDWIKILLGEDRNNTK